jgi:hypothetical protein
MEDDNGILDDQGEESVRDSEEEEGEDLMENMEQ